MGRTTKNIRFYSGCFDSSSRGIKTNFYNWIKKLNKTAFIK